MRFEGDRGIDPSTQLRFRLGYAANERFALKEHLGKLGVSTDAMVEAGLLVSGEDIPLPYDRFRERVIFPITDLRDRVIAFGGRALDPDAPEATRGFLLNHLITELLPEREGGYRFSNSDPVTGQAAWYDLRVAIEKAAADEQGETSPRFEPLPPKFAIQPEVAA